ncbi:MAG: hypothetical protein GW778_05215 [Alphaproteobacteria bacterium]|nr:hypothetical protein [Alphaproteobacteria bacterium]
MAYLSSDEKQLGSIFPLSAADSRVKSGQLSTDIESTGRHEAIRASRALAIIHALKCLVKSGQVEVLDSLAGVKLGDSLSAQVKNTLGQPIVDAMCRGARSQVSHRVLECNVGLIEDVLRQRHGQYHIEDSKYQRIFEEIARTKPKTVQEIMPKLSRLRDAFPDDFAQLKGQMDIGTEGLSFQARGLLGASNLVVPRRLIEPAEELLVIGFDPDSYETRLEF